MNKENVNEVLKSTIIYANNQIKKKKKKYIIIFISIIVLCLLYILMFKVEIPIKYNKDIIDVKIVEDGGINIYINLDNYKETRGILVKNKDNSYDLYINVTETLYTRFFKDNDKSNNLLRIGNGMIIDFQSGKLEEYIPNESKTDVIKNIYYIDNLSNKVKTMTNTKLLNYKNKKLILSIN